MILKKGQIVIDRTNDSMLLLLHETTKGTSPAWKAIFYYPRLKMWTMDDWGYTSSIKQFYRPIKDFKP